MALQICARTFSPILGFFGIFTLSIEPRCRGFYLRFTSCSLASSASLAVPILLTSVGVVTAFHCVWNLPDNLAAMSHSARIASS